MKVEIDLLTLASLICVKKDILRHAIAFIFAHTCLAVS